jgi:HSP20 family molecular chaperone IbpA
MSPFSQLTSVNAGYGGGIDRDFSPILNYLDEFDRHFSRRHRFVNCFIPRFDLEEDQHNYYLYGDIPGASVEDITVEAHDNHTLEIYGKTNRAGPHRAEDKGQDGNEDSGFVKVNADDRDRESERNERRENEPTSNRNRRDENEPNTNQERREENDPNSNRERRDEKEPISATPAAQTQTFPPPPTEANPNPPAVATHPQGRSIQGHPHHQRLRSTLPHQPENPTHKILLSERLVGEFHRTFAFPSAVREEGVQASMENGVLSLVVPKKEQDLKERDKGRRIPILHGKWWQGQERGSGFGFASGAV